MAKGKKNYYPEEVLEFIKNNYIGTSNLSLIEMVKKNFGVTLTKYQMKSIKGRYKLKSGLTGRFEKGHVPANKGTKGLCKPNKTSYKKGNIPGNTVPVGTEIINSDGYTFVKVDDQGTQWEKWLPKHRVVYEKYHGRIPEGYCVLFADGDKTNFDIDNLVLVTNAERLFLNRHHLIFNDSELTKTSVLVARVDCLSRKKEKGE